MCFLAAARDGVNINKAVYLRILSDTYVILCSFPPYCVPLIK